MWEFTSLTGGSRPSVPYFVLAYLLAQSSKMKELIRKPFIAHITPSAMTTAFLGVQDAFPHQRGHS